MFTSQWAIELFLRQCDSKDGSSVCVYMPFGGLAFEVRGDRRELADRIIACVNACTGIPTDSLKQGVVAAVCRVAELALRAPDALGIREQPDIDLDLVEAALTGREALKTAGHEV